MSRNATLVTLIVLEVACAALAAFHHFALRVRVLAAFEAEGTEIPALTRVALAPWLQPAALAVAAVLTVVALLAPLTRARRQRALGAGVLLLGASFVFGVVFALLPAFRP